jgi:predicted enzyme related to lactoylglutathione lyase
MTSGVRTILHPVKDLAEAKALYGKLFGEPAYDKPYYVQFNVGDLEVGLDPQGHSKGMTGSVCYWQVDDIEGSVEQLLDAGAETVQAVTEVGPGRRIATVKDVDGNVIGLLQQS